MAKAEVKLPEELLTKLSRLGQNTDAVAEKVLQAGGKVVFDKVRDNLESVIGSDTKRKSRSASLNRVRMERATRSLPIFSNTASPDSRQNRFCSLRERHRKKSASV